MGLANEAIRMRKRKYRDPQVLADELYTMFLTDTDNNPGPVNITYEDGSNAQDPFALAPDPFTGFLWPDLNLPLPNPNPSDLQKESQDDTTNPTQRTRKRTVTQVLRSVIPGFVKSGSGDTYTVTIYPMGPDETDTAFDVMGVKQMQIDSGETIPANTACFVWRFTRFEITIREILETGAGTQGDRLISRTARIKVIKRSHYIQVPVWLSDM